MKIHFLLIVLSLASFSFGQDCYRLSSLENFAYDFDDVWNTLEFEGTIGQDNKRIQVYFERVEKTDSPHKYLLKGKSKVGKNICDFEGYANISSLKLLDTDNIMCEGPDYSFGILEGTYKLAEDRSQKYVGVFEGRFRMMFSKESGQLIPFSGLHSDEDTHEFVGSWTGYGKEQGKYCAWGIQIPPSPREDLFIYNENSFYRFNKEYLKKGWETYVVANLGAYLTIQDGNGKWTMDPKKIYSQEFIDRCKAIEKEKWWRE